MNTDKEKRIAEAFAAFESGESLATLQRIFPDVAVELNQMIEAQHILKQGKEAMRPRPELARRIIAALNERQKKREASIFMSGLWRLAAPVGIAALAFMFILSAGQTVQPVPAGVSDTDTMAAKIAAPEAQNTSLSLMAVEAPQPEAATLMTAGDEPQDSGTDTLYLWQMVTLGLLTALSALVLVKHWLVRRK